MVSAVLRLWLEEEERGQDQDLGADEEEHDLATPVQLIRVDEEWENR